MADIMAGRENVTAISADTASAAGVVKIDEWRDVLALVSNYH